MIKYTLVKVKVTKMSSVNTHPLFELLEKLFQYVAPGIPVLTEYPLELIEPTFVLILGDIPDLLIF